MREQRRRQEDHCGHREDLDDGILPDVYETQRSVEQESHIRHQVAVMVKQRLYVVSHDLQAAGEASLNILVKFALPSLMRARCC